MDVVTRTSSTVEQVQIDPGVLATEICSAAHYYGSTVPYSKGNNNNKNNKNNNDG